jgi:hypothetical protein
MRVSLLAFYAALFLLALVPTVIFGVWVTHQSWELKDKISAWDPFIKTMAIAGAVVVGLASLERFLDQRQQELAKDMVSRGQNIDQIFQQAIKTTSSIATAKEIVGPTDVQEAVSSFWKLYWGELARVEGPAVETAMVRFGNALKAWQAEGKKPQEMEQLALQVSYACKSEAEAYNKIIDDFKNRYSPF